MSSPKKPDVRLGCMDYSYFDLTSEQVAEFRDQEIFLTSFPRSGNTWMRHLVSTAMGRDREEAVPDIHIPGFSISTRLSQSQPPVMFKSHNISNLLSRRHIYLFRQPTDALVSYAHLAERGGSNCDEFVCERLLSWIWHVESARIAALSKPENWLLISYERLLVNTESCLEETFRFLGMSPSSVDIPGALAVKRVIPSRPSEGGYVSATVGKGKAHVSREVWKLVQTHALGSYKAIARVENEALERRRRGC